MSLVVNQVVKTYGTQHAVNGISFTAKPGEIVGFLGPNGAGKSTTMKIATGYIPPTSGSVQIMDISVQESPIKAQRHIGYLPEHNPLYLDAYVHEYLNFVAGIQGVASGRRKQRVKEVVALCGLEQEQNKRIAALSKGYRQRVGLAQALVHDPAVLILDEPTTGLDPNQIIEIREVIRGIQQNKTVVFSTHIMQEVQALCNRVVIINKGNLVTDSRLDDLQRLGNSNVVRVEFENDTPASIFDGIMPINKITQLNSTTYQIISPDNKLIRRAIIEKAAIDNWQLLGFGIEENTLETIFKELTQNPA